MTIHLYDAIVPGWQQTLGALAKVLDKAKAHCAEKQLPDSALTAARLAPDMFPLGFQIRSATVHSAGAIAAVRKGVFTPDRTPTPDDLDALKSLITKALEDLAQVDPAEVNGFVGRDMQFQAGERKIDFIAENYLLSFAQPNFFFHAVTAYDILRNQGVVIGKLDYLGMLRKKP